MDQLVSFFQKNVTLPSINPDYTSYLYDGPVFTFQSLVVELLSTMNPVVVFVVFVVLSLAYFAWIKIRYPFWNTQPVRHTYSWLPKEGVMNQVLPKTKFYDTTGRISTRDWSSVTDKEIDEMCRLLQSHWIPSDRIFCGIQVPDLAASGASIMTTFREKVYSTGQDVSNTNLLGMVLSRPAKLWVRGSDKTVVDIYSDKVTSVTDILAQDYLAVLRDRPVEDTRRLFDTHEYNARLLKPEYKVSVFRKEVELLEGVVPLVEYTCYTFYLRNLKVRRLPRDFSVVRVQTQNTDLLHDFLRAGQQMFDVAITLEIGVLLNLLKTNQMYMYALKRGDQVFALYWFKNAHVKSDLGDTLHFVASFRNTENEDLFRLGFSHSLREVLREYREYRMMMMDFIGHNGSVVELWTRTHDIIVETRCAYYLYNWGIPEKLREQCLVIV
jgi:hypothetical protein